MVTSRAITPVTSLNLRTNFSYECDWHGLYTLTVLMLVDQVPSVHRQ